MHGQMATITGTAAEVKTIWGYWGGHDTYSWPVLARAILRADDEIPVAGVLSGPSRMRDGWDGVLPGRAGPA
jgi:hypothetical protein